MYTCSTLNIRALYSYYIYVKHITIILYAQQRDLRLMLSYADGFLVGDYLCLGTRV